MSNGFHLNFESPKQCLSEQFFIEQNSLQTLENAYNFCTIPQEFVLRHIVLVLAVEYKPRQPASHRSLNSAEIVNLLLRGF